MNQHSRHLLVALLLRLYPRDFRDHFGGEIRLDLAKRSTVGWFLDLAVNGLRERFRTEVRSARSTRVGIACIILAVLHFLYDFVVKDQMGISAVLLTTALAAVGVRLCWRRSRFIPL